MLICPDEFHSFIILQALVHLVPGDELVVEVAGDLDVVPKDAGGVVAAPAQERVGQGPELRQSRTNIDKLDQGATGQVAGPIVNVLQDLLGDVLGTRGCVQRLQNAFK